MVENGLVLSFICFLFVSGCAAARWCALACCSAVELMMVLWTDDLSDKKSVVVGIGQSL